MEISIFSQSAEDDLSCKPRSHALIFRASREPQKVNWRGKHITPRKLGEALLCFSASKKAPTPTRFFPVSSHHLLSPVSHRGDSPMAIRIQKTLFFDGLLDGCEDDQSASAIVQRHYDMLTNYGGAILHYCPYCQKVTKHITKDYYSRHFKSKHFLIRIKARRVHCVCRRKSHALFTEDIMDYLSMPLGDFTQLKATDFQDTWIPYLTLYRYKKMKYK